MENKQSNQQFSIQNTAKLNVVNGIKMKIVLSSSMRNVLHNREENWGFILTNSRMFKKADITSAFETGQILCDITGKK